MSGRFKTRVYAALALAAGLALRLWFIGNAARIDGDTLLYGSIARNWMQHGVYGFSQSTSGPLPTLIRLPGYPLFLMVCFRVFGVEHYAAVMYLQCGIDLVTCVLIAALAGRLFGQRAAMAALWLAALCPFMAAYTAAPLTEVLTLFTITLAFYGVERWRSVGMGFNRWLWVLTSALLIRCCSGRSRVARRRCDFGDALDVVASRRIAAARRGVPHCRSRSRLFVSCFRWCPGRRVTGAHLCGSAAGAAFCDRPGRTGPAWLSTLVPDMGDRLRLDRGGVLELRQRPRLRSAICPTAPSTRAISTRRTAAILNQYNRNFNATPALEARFEEAGEERIHDDPIRYYLGAARREAARHALSPGALRCWRCRSSGGDGASIRDGRSAGGLAALNLGYFLLGGIGLWRWRRSGWGPHSLSRGRWWDFLCCGAPFC